MKKSLLLLPFLLGPFSTPSTFALVQGNSTTTTIHVTGGRYDLKFGVTWVSDDYPQASSPGRVELFDDGGNLVGWLAASASNNSGPQVNVTLGSASDIVCSIDRYATNGTPADGNLSGIWQISGLADGLYTLRFWTYRTSAPPKLATTVVTTTHNLGGSSPPPPNQPPTISWNAITDTVASGQTYTVSAHGHDPDGNLAQVNVWKNGQPFAFGGGGNGTDADSGNPTSDTGPQTVTFTAQAVDATGAKSAVITQTVTITAPNNSPSISWTSNPGTVASGQSYTVSAHGHDQDGNLVHVTVWKNGQPFALGGGGNGTDADASNSASDTGPQTITFTAQSVDAAGATSAIISQTVTIGAANHPPTISWNTTPGTVASGQSYSISAHGHDQDGNLIQVNVWRNGQPFAMGGGGNGTDADSGRVAIDGGPQMITYTAQAVDSDGATSALISQTVAVTAPNRAPLISWNGAVGTVASGQSYTVSAHGHDDDGNLTQVIIWKNGLSFAQGGAGDGSDADSGNPTSDTGPQTVTFTAQAVDAGGATSEIISQTVTITAPPPLQYTLATSATAGGSVSAGGTFVAGTVVTVSAFADATHDFSGWGGDAAGTANPLSITLDRNKSVQATFTSKIYVLATSATAGGTVTPGGSYPVGTTVTISAAPDSTHYFSGWSGDASGTALSVDLTLDRSKSAQANFVPKTAQTITFGQPQDQAVGSQPFAPSASASSGLSVNFTVVSGPATITGGLVHVTGAGAVVIQASQPGDAFYLPATPVTKSFNVTAPVQLKYRGPSRALLSNPHTANGTPLVIQVP